MIPPPAVAQAEMMTYVCQFIEEAKSHANNRRKMIYFILVLIVKIKLRGWILK
jgi:hypothetical protein